MCRVSGSKGKWVDRTRRGARTSSIDGQGPTQLIAGVSVCVESKRVKNGVHCAKMTWRNHRKYFELAILAPYKRTLTPHRRMLNEMWRYCNTQWRIGDPRNLSSALAPTSLLACERTCTKGDAVSW